MPAKLKAPVHTFQTGIDTCSEDTSVSPRDETSAMRSVPLGDMYVTTCQARIGCTSDVLSVACDPQSGNVTRRVTLTDKTENKEVQSRVPGDNGELPGASSGRVQEARRRRRVGQEGVAVCGRTAPSPPALRPPPQDAAPSCRKPDRTEAAAPRSSSHGSAHGSGSRGRFPVSSQSSPRGGHAAGGAPRAAAW